MACSNTWLKSRIIRKDNFLLQHLFEPMVLESAIFFFEEKKHVGFVPPQYFFVLS